MALSITARAFWSGAASDSQLCRIDPRFCDCALRDVADSVSGSGLGGKSALWFVALAWLARMDRSGRRIRFNGLRLLVVALGQSYGPALLAISQRPSHRSRYGCNHRRAVPFR